MPKAPGTGNPVLVDPAPLLHIPAMPFRSTLLPFAFLLLGLPVLLFNVLLVPAGEVPDELAHLIRAEGLLHGSIVGQRSVRTDGAGNQVPDSGVRANAGLIAVFEPFPPGTPLAGRVWTHTIIEGLQRRLWERKPEFVRAPNTAVYAPTFYIPAAVALQAARSYGAGPWESVYWARAANALCYALMGFTALLLARRGGGLILATLVLPMSLSLGASCSQDGLLIGSAALAAAALSRGTARAWWGGTLLLAAVATSKLLYLPLAGFAFLLAPGPAGGLRQNLVLGRRFAAVALVAVPALAWFAVANRYAVVPFVRGAPYAAGPYWPGTPGEIFGVVDSAKQIQVLLHQPSLLFRLPFEALGREEGLWVGMIGVLGQLDVRLPQWLYRAWAVVLLAAMAADMLSDRAERRYRSAAVLAGVIFIPATAAALYLGQYLSWTHIGWTEIEGMQGRYFIPLLPFVGLALPWFRLAGAVPARIALLTPTVLAGIVGLAVIPVVIVAAYYTGP